MTGINQKFLLIAVESALIGELKKGGVMTIEATSPVRSDPAEEPSLHVKKLVLP